PTSQTDMLPRSLYGGIPDHRRASAYAKGCSRIRSASCPRTKRMIFGFQVRRTSTKSTDATNASAFDKEFHQVHRAAFDGPVESLALDLDLPLITHQEFDQTRNPFCTRPGEDYLGRRRLCGAICQL